MRPVPLPQPTLPPPAGGNTPSPESTASMDPLSLKTQPPPEPRLLSAPGDAARREADPLASAWSASLTEPTRPLPAPPTYDPTLRTRDKGIELAPGVTLRDKFWLGEIKTQRRRHPESDYLTLLLNTCRNRDLQPGYECHQMDLEYQSDEHRLAFLLKIAADDPHGFAMHAHKVSSMRFDERLALATQCGDSAAMYLDNFIADESDRQAMLQELAKNPATAGGVAMAMDKLQVTDPVQRTILARACMDADAESTGDYIEKFNILDEAERSDLANQYFQSADLPDLSNLLNFGLRQSDLLDCLQKLAHDPATASQVAGSIEKFSDLDDAQRTLLAWACMEAAPEETAECINAFNLPDEAERYRLAIKYFQSAESADAENLWKFDLHSVDHLQATLRAAARVLNNSAEFDELVSYLDTAVSDVKHRTDLKIHFCIQVEMTGVCEDDVRKCLAKLQSEAVSHQSPAARLFLATLLKPEERKQIFEQTRQQENKRLPSRQDPTFDAAVRQIRQEVAALANADIIDIENHVRMTADARAKAAVAQAAIAKLHQQVTLGQPSIAGQMRMANAIPSEADACDWPTLRWIRNAWFSLQCAGRSGDSDTPLLPALARLTRQPDEAYRWTLTCWLAALKPSQMNSLPLVAARQAQDNARPATLAMLTALPLNASGLLKAILSLPPKVLKDGHSEKRLIQTLIALGSGMQQPDVVSALLQSVFPAEDPTRKPATIVEAENRSAGIQRGNAAANTESHSSSLSRLTKTDFDLLMRNLAKCRLLLLCDTGAAEKVIAGSMTLGDAVSRWTQSALGLPGKNLAKFDTVFLNYREPMTLPVYLSRIRYQPKTLNALSNFVSAVLAEKYPDVRYDNDDLLSKLTEAQQNLWKENVSEVIGSKGFTLRFTDDHQSLVRMGSDVAGSCQRVDGDPSLNRGLIGTVMDGKHKLIALCDDKGQIVVRSVIRLMSTSDFENGAVLTPCAMVECMYPSNASEQNQKSLLEFSLAQARRMGLRLLTSDDIDLEALGKTGTRCNETLYSGRLAYPVYCDARGGIEEKRITIRPDNVKKMSWVS